MHFWLSSLVIFFAACAHKSTPIANSMDQQCYQWAGQGKTDELRKNWSDCKKTNNERSTSLLMVASAREQIAVMDYLVQQGCDVNERDLSGDSPLSYAVSTDKTKAVAWLLEKGAGTKSYRRDQLTALMSAILLGKPDTVSLLLSAPGDINARMEDGWTALFYAVRRENLEILTKILRLGADLSLRSSENETALDLALEQEWTQGIQLLKSFTPKVPATQTH